MTPLCLQVSVPCCGFRQSRAREYAETYPTPPPATVYGFLLSLVGEENRYAHESVRLVIALKGQAAKSTVLRKIRRIKNNKVLTSTENSRPDYQELLTQLEFLVWVDSDQETSKPNLVERVSEALTTPGMIRRFGALSLGESRDLVNEVSIVEEPPHGNFTWVLPDENGIWSLPYWVDHVGSAKTRWQRYSFEDMPFREPCISDWTVIQKD